MYSNKRKVNTLIFLAACIFVSVAATKPSATKPAAIKNFPASDTGIFMNLKVLPKDISKDSLDHVMHNFTAALGVHCNFCHVRNNASNSMDFASDDKEEKNIARYMMNMTAGINKTYFNSENSTQPDTISVVRCFTCHRGNPHPDEMGMGDNDHNNMAPAPTHDNNGQPPPKQK
jgi:hypothetical protein